MRWTTTNRVSFQFDSNIIEGIGPLPLFEFDGENNLVAVHFEHYRIEYLGEERARAAREGGGA